MSWLGKALPQLTLPYAISTPFELAPFPPYIPCPCRTAPNALEELFPHDAHGLQGYIAAGVSPRSDQEDEDGDEFGFGVQEDEDDKGKAVQHLKVRKVHVCLWSVNGQVRRNTMGLGMARRRIKTG